MFIPLQADVLMQRRCWANWGLIAATVLVSSWAFADESRMLAIAGFEEVSPGGALVEAYGVRLDGGTPRFRRTLPAPLAALTCTFVHADILHLAGNMLFLWVFGNAINSRLGHARYLAVYFLAALVGNLAQTYGSDGPLVGASGAVNGAVAAFLVLYPRARITVLVMVRLFIRVARVAGFWLILFWLAWDVAMIWLDSGPVGHVAHVGGFVTGLAAAALLAAAGRLEPDEEDTLLELLGAGGRPARPAGPPARYASLPPRGDEMPRLARPDPEGRGGPEFQRRLWPRRRRRAGGADGPA